MEGCDPCVNLLSHMTFENPYCPSLFHSCVHPNIKENQLPEGRPNGLDIFEPGPDRQIMSARRWFDRELFCAEVVTLISYDLRPTETHICLTFVPDDPFGQTVISNVEQVATVIYREALANAAEARREGEGRRSWRGRLGEAVSRIRREGLDALRFPDIALAPANMRFYLYVPSECGHYGRDQFMRVPMAYRQGRFENPDFEHFDRVPAYIKNARFLEGV